MKHLLIIATLALSSTLTACAGFTPMNATSGSKVAFNQLDIVMGDGDDEGDRVAGFIIRQRLADRISPSGTIKYRLLIEPQSRRIGLGLTGQDFASRFDSRVTAKWTLIRIKDDHRIKYGVSQRTATYSADTDPYRLLSTNDAAIERASREVADDLLSDIAIALIEEVEGDEAKP